MGVSLCEFESRPPHPDTIEEKSKGFSSVSLFLLESLGDMEKVRTFVAVVWE